MTLAVLIVLIAHAGLRGHGATSPLQPASKTSIAPPNFDVRTSPDLKAGAVQRLGRGSSVDMLARVSRSNAAAAQLRALLPDATVSLSPLTGGAQMVANPRGALTPPSADDSHAIVHGFLRSHAGLYGLDAADVSTIRFKGESVSNSGLRMLRGEQIVGGIPVFQSDARFVLDRQGRLIRTIGAFAPVTVVSAAGTTPAISSAAALVAAMKAVGIDIDAGDVSSEAAGTEERLTVANPDIKGSVTSKLVYFPVTPGVVTLAYQQFTYTTGPGDYLTIVDAASGTLLWRKNSRAYQTLPTQEARFSVYVQADGKTPADSPAPQSPSGATNGSGTQFPEIPRTIVSMSTAQDPVASPAGWLADGVTTTTGNNVDACVDRVAPTGCDPGTIDNNGRPVGNPDGASNDRDFLGNAMRDFNYTPPPQAGNPEAGTTATGTNPEQTVMRRGIVTQVFYVTNWYHDQLYQLGFDEAAGNFQTTNFTGMGLGSDAVTAQIQIANSPNVSFSTPPDGVAPQMRLPRLTGPTIDRDMALDNEAVIHELTHGVSNRLIGNGAGLEFLPGSGLDEGWSDFVALSLLNGTNADDPNGRYAFGAYSGYKRIDTSFVDNYTYGMRRFPYTTDNTINPLTWADIDDVTRDYSGGIPINPIGYENNGSLDNYNVGELWALTLWEIRSRIIADPDGANGDVPAGNRTMLQLVIDAMKLTPANPSIVDAREALIAADCATNACANERWIWEGFADRGFGFGAAAPLGHGGLEGLGSHMSLRGSSVMPNLTVSAKAIDDSLGNNNGAIDPGEPIRLAVTLRNPYHAAPFNVANASATLTTSTPGVTIVNGTTTFGALAAQASAPGTPLMIRLDQTPACGSAIDFTLTVNSSLGATSEDFLIRVGTASGTGAPITYTRTLTPALGIPDINRSGVIDSMTITDDFEIADLDFRIDSLLHTFISDLSVLLRSPQGYGSDLIWKPGYLNSTGGDQNNLTNVTISDQAVNDLTATETPTTGLFLPAFNAPFWVTQGFTADPVGQLSRHNGTRTKGTWHVQVADDSLLDTGSLEGWSMIVTPRAFTCAPFVDNAPPVTTTTLTPTVPNGTNGWFTTPSVLATVAAIDVTGTVTETRCALDLASSPGSFNGLPPGCAFSGAGASVSTEGQHYIHAASVDGSGNLEVPKITAIRIDRTPPIVQCTLPVPTFTQNQAGAMVTATVTDATSGPLSTTLSAAADTTTSGAKTVQLTGVDVAGNSTAVACGYTVTEPPSPEPLTYFLVEGSTGSFFSTDVALANPHATPAHINLTFLKGDGTTVEQDRTLPPTSRTTIAVRDIAGLAETPLSTIVSSLDLLPIGVERTMTWDSRSYGGHGEAAIAQPRTKWYFGEGSSGFFSTYILLVNPNAAATTATLTFLTESGGVPVVREYGMAARSRLVVDTSTIAELTNSSFGFTVEATQPIGVERSMYFGNTPTHLFTGGHAAAGAPDPSSTWYFAEGATGVFFDTYILLSNPGTSPARATLTYLLDDGTTVTEERTIAPNGRTTVSVEGSDPKLINASFSTQVVSDVPIVAERSMYWGDASAALPWTEGHNSTGVTAPGPRWLLAEGRVGGPLAHQTYILLGNPSTTTAAEVTITYLRTDGSVVTKPYVVPPTSRVNVFVNDMVPELHDEAFGASVVATNGVAIIVERSLYWNADGIVWAGGTNATATRMP